MLHAHSSRAEGGRREGRLGGLASSLGSGTKWKEGMSQKALAARVQRQEEEGEEGRQGERAQLGRPPTCSAAVLARSCARAWARKSEMRSISGLGAPSRLGPAPGALFTGQRAACGARRAGAGWGRAGQGQGQGRLCSSVGRAGAWVGRAREDGFSQAYAMHAPTCPPCTPSGFCGRACQALIALPRAKKPREGPQSKPLAGHAGQASGPPHLAQHRSGRGAQAALEGVEPRAQARPQPPDVLIGGEEAEHAGQGRVGARQRRQQLEQAPEHQLGKRPAGARRRGQRG